MLHSGGMSGRQWRKLSEALSDRYQVILPDFLGSGSNPPWPDDQPFELGLDVDAVDALLPERFHLVGHSYGGMIALQLALRHPDRVASLIVYDPVAFGVLFDQNDPEGVADLQAIGSVPVFLDDSRGGGEEWMNAFVNYWNGPGAWEAMPEPSRQAFLRVGRKVYYEVKSLIEERTPLDAYGRLTMPASLVHGEKTPASARRVLELLSSVMPHSRLLSLPGAGHMGPLTHAPAFQQFVEAQLAQ